MKTSSKARYALYLMIDIARHTAEGPVPLREVSVRQSISLKYLEQIASSLSKCGYLESVRGAQGGYRLARAADTISAGDIMRAAEGGFIPVSCLDAEADACPRQASLATGVFAESAPLVAAPETGLGASAGGLGAGAGSLGAGGLGAGAGSLGAGDLGAGAGGLGAGDLGAGAGGLGARAGGSLCCGTAGFWQGLREVIDTYTNQVSLAELAAY